MEKPYVVGIDIGEQSCIVDQLRLVNMQTLMTM